MDKKFYDEICELCEFMFRTEHERQTILESIFIGNSSRPSINIIGSSDVATRAIVSSLFNFGALDNGQLALNELLSLAQNRVGEDKKARIQALQEVISRSSLKKVVHMMINIEA